MFKKYGKALGKLIGEIKKTLSKPSVRTALCACAAFAIFLAEIAEQLCMFPYYFNECEYPKSMLEAENEECRM